MQPAFDVHVQLNGTIVLVNRCLLVGRNVAIHNLNPPSVRMASSRRRVIPKFPFVIRLSALQLPYFSLYFALKSSNLIGRQINLIVKNIHFLTNRKSSLKTLRSGYSNRLFLTAVDGLIKLGFETDSSLLCKTG